LAALLARLLTLGVPPEENRGRLALVAGVALAFVTVAIPLQFEREWLTLGWALLGAALAWLWGRIPHRALVLWSLTLFGAAFVRLAFNPAVLAYHPRTPTPVWNWYLAVYTAAAAAFFIGFALFRRTESVPYGGAVRLLPAGGTALLFVLLNLEIADFFAEGSAPSFNVLSSSLSEGLAYTLSWALFAIALLVAGLLVKSRPARIAALVLLVVTILKCFLFDLAQLGGGRAPTPALRPRAERPGALNSLFCPISIRRPGASGECCRRTSSRRSGRHRRAMCRRPRRA
jgi:uncharacterized membrane protein